MTARKTIMTSDPKAAPAVRRRQSTVASAIAQHLRPITEIHPELWMHHTFLLIVRKVYEYVVLCEDISPKDFLDLTRTLVEGCKVDAKYQQSVTPEREPGEGRMMQESGVGCVENGLEQLVRQIYGANLHDEQPGAPPTPAPSKSD